MPLALTSQEKKVLGFIAVMVVLGLVVLGVKKIIFRPEASVVQESSGAVKALRQSSGQAVDVTPDSERKHP